MNPVNMVKLRQDLVGENRIPKGYSVENIRIELFDKWKNSLGWHVIRVRPQQEYRNLHRIFVVCPLCNREIPAGRLAQHHKHSHKENK